MHLPVQLDGDLLPQDAGGGLSREITAETLTQPPAEVVDSRSMPLDIIRSYRSQRATHHQLMRRLVSYDGWFAPMDVARHATGADSFEQICMYGDTCRRPPDQLWLFSSADDVMRAHERFAARSGYGLFPYAGPVAGIDLFAALSKRLLAVAIDIVGERDEAWVIDGPGLDVARRWGKALALERSIAECNENVFVDMLGYDDYLVFEKLDGTLAFMFESCWTILPTGQAMEATFRQGDYDAVWSGLSRNFR